MPLAAISLSALQGRQESLRVKVERLDDRKLELEAQLKAVEAETEELVTELDLVDEKIWEMEKQSELTQQGTSSAQVGVVKGEKFSPTQNSEILSEVSGPSAARRFRILRCRMRALNNLFAFNETLASRPDQRPGGE